MKIGKQYTRIRVAKRSTNPDQPPDLGQIAELVRNTLTSEYNVYPPNLSTAIQQDGSMVITAVNPSTGLNVKVTLAKMAGDLAYSGGQMPGMIPVGPPSQGAPPANQAAPAPGAPAV